MVAETPPPPPYSVPQSAPEAVPAELSSSSAPEPVPAERSSHTAPEVVPAEQSPVEVPESAASIRSFPPPYSSAPEVVPSEAAGGYSAPEVVPDTQPLFGTLVLDGTNIYLESDPVTILYKLGRPITDLKATQSLVYKTTHNLTSSPPSSSAIPIYSYAMSDSGRNLVVQGTASDRGTFSRVELAPSLNGWASCVAWDHFRVQTADASRPEFAGKTAWLNMNKEMLAAELPPEDKAKSKKSGKDKEMPCPRLRIVVPSESKEQDLLVACWIARTWKTTQIDMRQGKFTKKYHQMFGDKKADPRRLQLNLAQNNNRGMASGLAQDGA